MDPMTADGRAATELLARKESLAREATDALYADMPELTDRYGPVGRQRCHEDLRYTIDHLIPAVDLAQPELFVTYVHWLDDLLRARNVSKREVIRSLELIEQVSRTHLAADEADAVTRCIRAGLASLEGQPAER